MPKKKLTLNQLYALDSQADERSIAANCVRKLEMLVNDAMPRGYGPHCVQFWTDVRLYGLREAVMYLEQVGDAKPDAVARIKDFADQLLAMAACELCAR